MRFMPIDASRLQIQGLRVFEHNRWEGRGEERRRSEQQATTRDGVPQWSVKCFVTNGSDDEVIQVIVPADEKPEIDNEPVSFIDMSVKTYVSQRDGGSVGAEFYAKGVEKKAA